MILPWALTLTADIELVKKALSKVEEIKPDIPLTLLFSDE